MLAWYRDLTKQFKEWREDKAFERARMAQLNKAVNEWHKKTAALRRG